MAREATGEVRCNGNGAYSAVVRTWEKRETFKLPTCTEENAGQRSTMLADVAKRFRLASVSRAPDFGRLSSRVAGFEGNLGGGGVSEII
jgi:hypothetical protein